MNSSIANHKGYRNNIRNKMSKLRETIYNPAMKTSKSRARQLLERKGKKSILEQTKWTESKLLEGIKCKTEAREGMQQQKDHVYNKNITHYREAFQPRNSFILPFLSSLRHIKDYRQEQAMSLTIVQPFDASNKDTANQKIKKNINDMTANPFRLSKAYYRWHNSSGAGVKADCEFECTLRLSKNSRNPEQSAFNNTIRPIRYRTVQERRYDPKELICDRQRKLFTLAALGK